MIKNKAPMTFVAIAIVTTLVAALPAFANSGTGTLEMQSAEGDYVGGGTNWSVNSADGDFTATLSVNDANEPDEVFIYFLGSAEAGSFWDLDFSTAQLDVPLAVGSYTDAQRAAFAESGHAGLDIGGNGRGCNSISGSFTVTDFTYEIVADPLGGSPTFNVLSFAATFEQHCEGADPALTGTVTFQGTSEGGTSPTDPNSPTTPTTPSTPRNVTLLLPTEFRDLALGNSEAITAPVTFSLLSDYDQDLQLSAKSFPDDLDITFDPPMILKGTADEERSTMVTITTRPLTIPMPHIVQLRAMDEDGTEYFHSFLMDVVCDPPLILGLPEDQPASQAIPYGSSATLTVNPTGGTEPYFFQWYQGHTGNREFPIDGATEASYTTDPIMQPTDFWVSVTNACGEYRSWTATVTPSESKGTTRGRRHGVRPGSGG